MVYCRAKELENHQKKDERSKPFVVFFQLVSKLFENVKSIFWFLPIDPKHHALYASVPQQGRLGTDLHLPNLVTEHCSHKLTQLRCKGDNGYLMTGYSQIWHGCLSHTLLHFIHFAAIRKVSGRLGENHWHIRTSAPGYFSSAVPLALKCFHAYPTAFETLFNICLDLFAYRKQSKQNIASLSRNSLSKVSIKHERQDDCFAEKQCTPQQCTSTIRTLQYMNLATSRLENSCIMSYY